MKKLSLYILILTMILNTTSVFANMAFNPWPGQYGVNSWGDNTYSYGRNYGDYTYYGNSRRRLSRNRTTNNTVRNIIRAKRLADMLGK